MARRSQVAWTHEMRTTLWLMWKTLKLERETRTAAFNTLYKDSLADMGFPDGIDMCRIDFQYSKQNLDSSGWRQVVEQRASDAEVRKDLLRRIKAVLAGSGPLVEAPITPLPDSRKRSHEQADEATSATKSGSPPVQPRKRTLLSVTITTTPVPVTEHDDDGAAKPPRWNATIPHTTEAGYTVRLTPKEYAKTQGGQLPVPDSKAHPLPTGSLLFRYWDENSQCPIKDGGLKAKRFAVRHLAPPPLPKSDSVYFDWNDLHAHLNRDKTETSFVSTSNCLVWVLRLALKEAKRGVQGGRIAIIDGDRLPKDQVLHAAPFLRELRKTFSFTDGAWRYPATHEFVVYAKIPAAAILHPGVELGAIRALATQVPVIGQALQFDILDQRGDFHNSLRVILGEAKVQLLPSVINAVARIIRELLPGGDASAQHISHLVTDIIQGWAFEIEAETTPEEWLQMSTIFSHVLCKGNILDLGRQHLVRAAFLDGVKWACGDFNSRFTAVGIRATLRKAALAGLQDPMAIVDNGLDAAKVQTAVFFHRQQLQIEQAHGQIKAGTKKARRVTQRPTMDENDVHDTPCAARIARAVVPPAIEVADEGEQIVFERPHRRQRVS
ncbi:hypothetical protein LTR97_002943 [Elasticomyces elasticus]|uniref:DUF7587 domain-containing protein n=1 Tax=Elasticomyces elasticus TaxID=574655 RepID=A0AAN7WNT4_9PEZI|nr:hypothetical protein LTR97_002943 [Elasticomyces elasticus]